MQKLLNLKTAGVLTLLFTTSLSFTVSADNLAEELVSAVPPSTRLVVAEQNDQASIPWRLSGVGEGAPYDISFANFNGGPAVLEALISGAADIGYIGEAPLPIAVSRDVDDLVAVAVNANPGSPANYYLVVDPNSGIETVADLKGKTLAYPPGTGRHMVASAIIHDAGLEFGRDVTAVEVAGAEVAPTFASGAVDAAIVLGAQYFRVGEPKIIDDGAGYNWGANVVVVRKAILDDPAKEAAIADFLRRTVEFYNWQGHNLDEWIEARYVGQQGLTFEQGEWLEEQAGHGAYYPIDERVVEVLQEVSDGLLATGALARDIDIAPFVDSRFNHVITYQNQVDGIELRPLEQPATTAQSQ